MPFFELRYFSDVLGINTACNVITPNKSMPGPFHVMFLLHGLSDDHTIWSRRTSIERYVEGLPLIVVMPTTGRGFYVDAVQGPAYGTAIGCELPEQIEHLLPVKGPWCVTGLSMGGYGAVSLALSYPKRFTSAHSHSGALGFGHLDPSEVPQPVPEEFIRIVGPNPPGSKYDLHALAEKIAVADRPKIRFDCGVEDFLIEHNREYHKHLTAIGYEHEYEEFSGAHTWAYWDEHIQEAIAFHRKNLGF